MFSDDITTLHLTSSDLALGNDDIDLFDDLNYDSDWMSIPGYDHRDLDHWMQQDTSHHYVQQYTSANPDYYSFPPRSANNHRPWSQTYDSGFSPYSATQTPPHSRLQTHRRALSNSTASTNSPQQYPQSLLDSNRYSYLQNQYYPTPLHTPTSGSFMDQDYSRGAVAPAPRPVSAASQTKQYPPQIQTSGPSYSPHPQQQYQGAYLTPHSATPNTGGPHSTGSDYGDRRFAPQQQQQQQDRGPMLQQQSQQAQHGQQYYGTQQQKPPQFEHSVTQICADEGYNPLDGGGPPQRNPQQQPAHFLMPDHMQDRLSARSAQRQGQHPYEDIKREPSPYKPDSQLAREDSNLARMPDAQVGTAMQQRQQQKLQDDSYQYWRHHTRGEKPDANQETISPADAYIDDFKEPTEEAGNGAPLFPSRSDSSQHQLFSGNSSQQSYAPINGSRYPQHSFTFQTPGIPASSMPPTGADYKYAPLGRQDSSSEDTPTHLVSMETSKSEPESSQDTPQPRLASSRELSSTSNGNTPISTRPSGSISTADTGTYSCTYIGCPQRFPTPALLQKHKKDAHRPAPGHTSRGASTAAATISSPIAAQTPTQRSASPRTPGPRTPVPDLQGLSQAGPHRCDRINPSTGKPCNTVFSRPYDLTRHEDTIHARRPKVHCKHCAARGEEKTFSRADALTRHLRVVHPEIEVRGLHGRRRGL